MSLRSLLKKRLKLSALIKFIIPDGLSVYKHYTIGKMIVFVLFGVQFKDFALVRMVTNLVRLQCPQTHAFMTIYKNIR